MKLLLAAVYKKNNTYRLYIINKYSINQLPQCKCKKKIPKVISVTKDSPQFRIEIRFILWNLRQLCERSLVGSSMSLLASLLTSEQYILTIEFWLSCVKLWLPSNELIVKPDIATHLSDSLLKITNMACMLIADVLHSAGIA